jgi:hypothetical protein
MRSIVKLLVFAGLIYFGWHMYHKTLAAQAAAAAAEGTGETGFMQTGDVDESERDVVLILRPANCPSEQAQRADALDRELTKRHIPHTMGDSMSITDDNPTRESVDDHNRAMKVFNQGAPAVYINGWGKSNPTADEVEAEYKRTRRAS